MAPRPARAAAALVVLLVLLTATACRERGMRYDMDTVRSEYERWFVDLYDLWEGGWDNLNRSSDR